LLKLRLLVSFFLFFLTSYLFALEISIDSAKDNYIKYSTLSLIDDNNFTCQEIKDDFAKIKTVTCTFSKRTLKSIKPLENDFFKVYSFVKNNQFYIQITPKYKVLLFADIFDLTQDNIVFQSNVHYATRWTLLGYKDKKPLIKEQEKTQLSLDFPFYYDKDKLPFVGSLDINGNPVFIKKVEDVKEYLEVKKLFKAKKYTLALDRIENILQNYPNTLFGAELLYYKLKIYTQLKDYDNVVDSAKIFLREYSSDENIPEVLSLVAKAYNDLGQNSDADYFFDRLYSEHPNSLYTYWGYIYKGEGLEDSGGEKKAEFFYKKALYGTKNIDVAVSAAYHLANLKVTQNAKVATKYIDKIIKIKPRYFIEKYKTSKDMMYEFANQTQYITAAKIAKAILDVINPTYDDYEVLLKDRALWLSKTKKKKEALEALNKYLKAFPDGEYINQVQIAKDGLFFELDDLNTSAKLKQYDVLIHEYGKDAIGQKALYEKAKLLLKNGHYNEVLQLKNDLETLDQEKFNDINTMIMNAAIGSMEEALKHKQCKQVLAISSTYKIVLSDKWDDGIYRCTMKGGDFQLAKNIANKHLHSDSIEQRKKWLFRYTAIDYEIGNYKELIRVAQDLIALIDKPKTSSYKGVYRYIFDAYERLSQHDNMIKSMMQLEDVFGLDYKDIDRYADMVSLAETLHDDMMLIKYAKKVLNIQKRVGAYPQTPYVDFALYQAYINAGKYKQALKVLQFLDTIVLEKNERARQKYLLGNILEKLKRKKEAKKAYQEAMKVQASSPWAKLAKSALEL